VARYGTDLALAERTAHERLTRICFVDYDREIALVAEVETEDGPAVIGVARLSRLHATEEHQLSLVIADAWQRRGIGREMLRSAIDVARGEHAHGVVAELSPENHSMRSLLAEAGFAFEERDSMLIASLATG
jgi:acetyltransferase